MNKVLYLTLTLFSLSFNSSYANELKIEPGTKLSALENKLKLAQRNTLKDVDMSGVDAVTDKIVLDVILTHAKTLQSLNLKGCKNVKFHFSQSDLSGNTIFGMLPKIIRNIPSVNVSDSGLDWVGLLNLAEIFKNVTTLDLSGLDLTSDVPFYAPIISKFVAPAPEPIPTPASTSEKSETAENSEKKEGKNDELPEEVKAFDACDKDTGSSESSSSLPSKEYETCTSFTVTRVVLDRAKVSQQASVLLFSLTPLTSSLSFVGSELEATVLATLPNKAFVNSLNLQGAKGFGDESLGHILSLPLEKLNLAGTAITTSSLLSQKSECLKTLEISLSGAVGSKALYFFGQTGGKQLALSYPHLSALVVKDDPKYQMNNDALLSLESCSKLAALDISSTKALTLDGVKAFLNKRKGKETSEGITTLKLPYFKGMTLENLNEVIALCPKLTKISIDERQLPRASGSVLKSAFPSLSISTY